MPTESPRRVSSKGLHHEVHEFRGAGFLFLKIETFVRSVPLVVQGCSDTSHFLRCSLEPPFIEIPTAMSEHA